MREWSALPSYFEAGDTALWLGRAPRVHAVWDAAEESDAAEEFSLCEEPLAVSDAAEESEGDCNHPREAASWEARRRRKGRQFRAD